ncbi:MAG: hypothetical protein FJ178_02370 [Gammaproteobacteria bacterium]|nr:hypothetical protein [Gammaproteobacteria bacterium]
MSHAKVTPQLRFWIIKQIEAGQSSDSVLQALVVKGWPEGAAIDVMQRTLRARVAQIKAAENAEQARTKNSLGNDPAE